VKQKKYSMNKIVAIGNGESRQDIDCSKIHSVTVSCNAYMREYIPHHLICVDKRMMEEAVANKHNQHACLYTRPEWIEKYKKYERVFAVPALPYDGEERPDQPFQWGSGPYSVLLAAKFSKDVHMIGFDLWSKTGQVNNVFKGTKNYDPVDKKAVDPRYWIHQIAKVFENFSDRKFIVYNKEDWIMPDNWKYSNVYLDRIENFSYI